MIKLLNLTHTTTGHPKTIVPITGDGGFESLSLRHLVCLTRESAAAGEETRLLPGLCGGNAMSKRVLFIRECSCSPVQRSHTNIDALGVGLARGRGAY
jgi:hypothetical protein